MSLMKDGMALMQKKNQHLGQTILPLSFTTQVFAGIPSSKAEVTQGLKNSALMSLRRSYASEGWESIVVMDVLI